MQAHHPLRIDQDVPSALEDVTLRCVQRLPPQDRLQVEPQGPRPEDVREGGGEHAVTTIRLPCLVDEEGPRQTGLLRIAPSQEVRLEGYNDNPDTPAGQVGFVITQLRAVRTAGESAEVPVEDHQEPVSAIVFEAVNPPFAVGKFKREGGFSCQVLHSITINVSRVLSGSARGRRK